MPHEYWEEEYAQQRATQNLDRLNDNPGYLAEDKLVLASTKNHAHRLYLFAGHLRGVHSAIQSR